MSKAAAFSGEKMGTAMQQTPALAYWMAAFLVMPITAILRYTGCFHKRKGTAEPRHTNGKRGEHMENRILARLDGRADPEWLLTLLSVLPLNTYTLEEWNEALSQAAGRRIFCPSYRTLSDYLHRLVLGVQ